MSGYDNQPDYGGPPVTWRTWVGGAVVIIGIAAVVLFFVQP